MPRKGSKGERWSAWAWLATASPRHSLLARRRLRTGELGCFGLDQCQARLYTSILHVKTSTCAARDSNPEPQI